MVVVSARPLVVLKRAGGKRNQPETVPKSLQGCAATATFVLTRGGGKRNQRTHDDARRS